MNVLAFLSDFANFAIFLSALACYVVNNDNSEEVPKDLVKFSALGFAIATSSLFFLYYLRILISECSSSKRSTREKTHKSGKSRKRKAVIIPLNSSMNGSLPFDVDENEAAQNLLEEMKVVHREAKKNAPQTHEYETADGSESDGESKSSTL
jgi:hypothetical protein